jgi:hypothetical protein
MSRLAMTVLALGSVVAAATGARADVPGAERVRFVNVEIYVDAGAKSLAAWQLEFLVKAGDVEVVGVEGGEHPAYTNPAYYDPSALREDRLVLAAFDTGANVPTGRTRVATLHLMVRGSDAPKFDVQLVVAADREGRSFDAVVSVEEGGVR